MGVSILIAQNDPLLRELLAATLRREEGFEIAGSVGSGAETVAAVTEYRPEVLVLDLGQPESAGLKVLDELGMMEEPPLILALSAEESEGIRMEVARRGAQGFLYKSEGIGTLTKAIRAVTSGEVWFTRQLVGQLLREYAILLRRVREEERPAKQLSSREHEILARVARGLSNQQIADELGMSLGTVKVHVRNIFQKFDLPNRTEAAVFAIREGLVDQADIAGGVPRPR